MFSSVRSESEPGWLSYHADYKIDQGGYEGLARVTVKGGKMSKSRAVGLRLTDADEILVLIRITPLEDGSQTKEAEVKAELAKMPLEYDELLTPHAKKHGEMFRRVTLDLGC